MRSLSFLMSPALQPEWLLGNAAYESFDGAVVRAYLEMLKTAMRAPVAGVIPARSEALAAACGLAEEKLILNWEILTKGWILTPDGNLYHDGVAKYCAWLCEQFGEQIDEIHSRRTLVEGEAQLGIKRAKKAPDSRVVKAPVFGGRASLLRTGALKK